MTPIMRGILKTSIRLFVFVIITNQVYYGHVIAANIIATGDLSQPMTASNDKSSLIGPRVHPYGSSFETINNRQMVEPEATQTEPMDTAASYYHHHSGGSKGWLDMGAWTKKKGAFGWYADFPVGKG